MSVAPTSLSFLPVYDIEHLWTTSLTQIFNGSTEVVIPFQVRDAIGDRGITDLVTRFSNFINAPASVLEDNMAGAVRILPPPHYKYIEPGDLSMPSVSLEPLTTNDASIVTAFAEAGNSPSEMAQKARPNAKIAKDRLSKVPRPPNAFILYRQHHHPLVKAKYPKIHNNQISVIIGNKWKNEDANTKIKFRQLANEMKQKHHQEHPDYQYQPRKPSEKKKRSSKSRVAVASLKASLPNMSAGSPVENQSLAVSTAMVPSLDQATATPSDYATETPVDSATTSPALLPNAEINMNLTLAPPMQYGPNGQVSLQDLLHMDESQIEHFFLPRETLGVDSSGHRICDRLSPFFFGYPAYTAENRDAHEASDDLLVDVAATMFNNTFTSFDG